jgi:hypothetical protein
MEVSKMKSKDWFALILILLGLLLLGDNLGLFALSNITRLWPVVLIIIGISVFIRKEDRARRASVEVSINTGKCCEPTTKVEPETVKPAEGAAHEDDEDDEV